MKSSRPTLRTALLCILIIYCYIEKSFQQEQQDPLTLNGGSVMAMAGDQCVAVIVDKRFGSGPQMINITPRKVLIPHSNVAVAFTGLEGDVQSCSQQLSLHISSKVGRHSGFGFGTSKRSSGEREISPKSLSMLMSHLLYGRRQSPYYVEPIIAGLTRVVERETENDGIVASKPTKQQCRKIVKYEPFVCAQDLIGAQSRSDSFACSGAASKSLYGMAEAMWRPGLKPDELVQICGRAFLSALERDCLSGYGATLYLFVGGQGITQYDLVCRND